MSADRLSSLVAELLGEIDRRIDAAVDERLEALRPLLIKDAAAPADDDEFGDALDAARVMGLDISTEAARKSARNKVYYLAGIKAIPSTRLSPKKLRFPLGRIRRLLTERPPEETLETSPLNH